MNNINNNLSSRATHHSSSRYSPYGRMRDIVVGFFNAPLYPGLQISGMTNGASGFTLIELLVVVLIIGILAAAALPQYQVAVAKSRLAAIKPLLADLKAAEEVYYMANGRYTASDTELDLSIADTLHSRSNGKLTDLFYVNLLGNAVSSAYVYVYYCPRTGAADATACSNQLEFRYMVWFEHSAKPNAVDCVGYTDLGRKVCKTAVQ